jgi:hypothetical protein
VRTLDSRSECKGLPTGRNPTWEFSPNAPGVMWSASLDLAGRRPDSVVHPLSITCAVGSTAQYDEVDLRLMDTFPASDAVGRY